MCDLKAVAKYEEFAAFVAICVLAYVASNGILAETLIQLGFMHYLKGPLQEVETSAHDATVPVLLLRVS